MCFRGWKYRLYTILAELYATIYRTVWFSECGLLDFDQEIEAELNEVVYEKKKKKKKKKNLIE
jgi:hypothetical protein